MADRYEDQYRRDRGYRRDERGFIDRAGDEVRSWFGDDEAERRRQMDDRYRGSADRGQYGDRYYGDRPYGSERYGSDRLRDGYYGADYGYGPTGSRYGSTSGYSGPYESSRPAYGHGGASQGQPGTFQDRSWEHRRFEEDRSRGMGWYAGRGPRGYQRSDARINEDVCDRLCDSPDVDATMIDVTVANGEVTLAGSVADRDQKRRAEDLIEQVSGVREVHNNLRVGSGQDADGRYAGTPSSSSTHNPEQPGNVIGVTGAPDRAASTARR